jgi:hypothetical protein
MLERLTGAIPDRYFSPLVFGGNNNEERHGRDPNLPLIIFESSVLQSIRELPNDGSQIVGETLNDLQITRDNRFEGVSVRPIKRIGNHLPTNTVSLFTAGKQLLVAPYRSPDIDEVGIQVLGITGRGRESMIKLVEDVSDQFRRGDFD